MASEWKKHRIKDVVSFVVDNRGKTPPTQDEGHILLEVNAVSATEKFPLYREVRKHVSQEVYDTRFRKGHPKKGDILVPTVGTLGAVSLMDRDDCCIAQNLIAIRCDEAICHSHFLYYVLCNPMTRKRLLNLDIGGVQPSIKVPHLMELEIELPSIGEQKKIAELLSLLDDKIFCNKRINDNLQQQALAIFQQELLREGALPNGWTSGSLLDIANYLNGLAMQKFRPADGESGLPVLKIKELRQGSCDASSELCSPSIKPEYIVHDGDVIFSWSGSLLVDLWCGGTCGLNQHLFKVTSDKYPKWFYYSWTAHHLSRFVAIAADKATTMGHIKREELAKAEVVIPDATSMGRISGMLQPIYDLIISNRIENRKLAGLRDFMLPRLMNGEIDVADIDA